MAPRLARKVTPPHRATSRATNTKADGLQVETKPSLCEFAASAAM